MLGPFSHYSARFTWIRLVDLFLHVNEMPLATRLGRTEIEFIGRSLLMLGAVIALVGAGVLIFSRLPFLGRLPGDISFHRDGFSVFLPIVTWVLISVILSVAANILIRILR
jgi:hypothetical protein